MFLAGVLAAAVASAYTVENDPESEFEVTKDGTYYGEVSTWMNSQSQRAYDTHIYRIRVPEGKVAIATLEYTYIDFMRDDWTRRGYTLSLGGETIASGMTSARRIYDKKLSSDGAAVIQGFSYGATPCYQTIYYQLTVSYEDVRRNVYLYDVTLYPDTPTVDDRISLDFKVVRGGNVSYVSGVKANVYLDGRLAKECDLGTIYSDDFEYLHFAPLPAGRHTIRIVLDPANTIDETNESDNTWETTFDVGGLEPYWVRYDPNGGAGSMPDSKALSGENLYFSGADTHFYRPGYRIKGWARNPDGPVECAAGEWIENFIASRDELVTFYAIWEPGDSVQKLALFWEGTESIVYRTATGGIAGSLPTEDDLGRAIAGWTRYSFIDYPSLGSIFIEPDSSIDPKFKYLNAIYADQYSPTGQVEITFSAENGTLADYEGLGLESTSGFVKYASFTREPGEKLGKMPSVVSTEGKKFLGWSTSTHENNSGFYVTEESIVAGGKSLCLYARFEEPFVPSAAPSGTPPKAYTATYYHNYDRPSTLSNGSISHFEYVRRYAVSSIAEVIEAYHGTRDGYTFAGWFTERTGGALITETTPLAGDITVYAHWTRDGGGEEEYPPLEKEECADCIDYVSLSPAGYEEIETREITAPYEALKAATLQGAVYDGDGAVVGVVELKLGKVNAKKKTSKVSGSFTGLDGRKSTMKAVTVAGVDGSAPATVSLAVKGRGTMTVTIGGDQFAGSLGDWHVQSADVGGEWTGDAAASVVADDLSMFAGTVLEELLPVGDGETVKASGGKWKFDKAAGVKWAKPKKGVALTDLDIYDEESGKGLVVDVSGGKTNLSAMKLAYTPKKGVFKGSFKVCELQGEGRKTKLKKHTVKVNGVVVDGVGSGEATCKKPALSWPVEVR